MQGTIKELKFYYSQQTSDEPLVDLYETDDDLVFEVDLPGVDPEEMLIKAVDDMLIIEGIKSHEADEGNRKRSYLCMERNRDSFRRVVQLPLRVNIHEGRAVYSHGVVTIAFPKFKEKVVKIKVGRR